MKKKKIVLTVILVAIVIAGLITCGVAGVFDEFRYVSEEKAGVCVEFNPLYKFSSNVTLKGTYKNKVIQKNRIKNVNVKKVKFKESFVFAEFENCNSLIEFEFESGIEIGNVILTNCSAMKEITIPIQLTCLTLKQCDNVERIITTGTIENLNIDYATCPSLRTIELSDDCDPFIYKTYIGKEGEELVKVVQEELKNITFVVKQGSASEERLKEAGANYRYK